MIGGDLFLFSLDYLVWFVNCNVLEIYAVGFLPACADFGALVLWCRSSILFGSFVNVSDRYSTYYKTGHTINNHPLHNQLIPITTTHPPARPSTYRPHHLIHMMLQLRNCLPQVRYRLFRTIIQERRLL